MVMHENIEEGIEAKLIRRIVFVRGPHQAVAVDLLVIRKRLRYRTVQITNVGVIPWRSVVAISWFAVTIAVSVLTVASKAAHDCLIFAIV